MGANHAHDLDLVSAVGELVSHGEHRSGDTSRRVGVHRHKGDPSPSARKITLSTMQDACAGGDGLDQLGR